MYTSPSLANVNTYVTYLFGPLIGATAAVLIFNVFKSEEPVAEEVQAAPEEAPAKPAAKRKTTAKAKK